MIKNPLPAHLAAQWHPEKNLPLTPSEVNAGSIRKVWWIGLECGHPWLQPIRDKNDENICLVCIGKRVLPGFNDLASRFPAIAKEWSSKNEFPPVEFTAKSNKKVWWLGTCGHEWEAQISHRTEGKGCPVCAGKKVIAGVNDFSSRFPALVKEWHPEKNLPLTPNAVSSGSNKKVWWQCATGHEWEATLKHRALLGRNCPYCAGTVLAGFNDVSLTHPHLLDEWHPEKNIHLPTALTSGSDVHVWWVCEKNHEWQARLANRARKNVGCPECSANSFISQGEQAINDFLVSHGLIVKQSERGLLKGMELDIYVPEKNIAIEYNGLYWHSEKAGKDKTYHYNKWLAAKNAGIQLIQIWEDEWNSNPEQVKSMLLHKLGISSEDKVFARKTFVKPLEKKVVEMFLEQYHIQGFASGSYYLGLFEKNSEALVSVVVLKKEANNTLNIIRYATSKNVVGGFTKLIAFAEKTYSPSRFITFSDHCVSDGGLYANNGFIADKELRPDYRYVVRGERKHKFGYRLKRFRNDPELQYVEGMTETQLAALNNLYRIWDAGKTRWVKEI